MKRFSMLLALAALVYTTGCNNQDLQNADNLVATGDLPSAITAYIKVIETGKNTNKARLSLAGVYYTQKSYEKALNTLSELPAALSASEDIVALSKKCTQSRKLLDGIKSATVQFRQHFIKEKEINHQDIDYATPLFQGTATELFKNTEAVSPATSDLDKYIVEIRQTDDPLEPTRLLITYPNGSLQELSLNY